MIKLLDIFNYKETKIFEVIDSSAYNELEWLVKQTGLEMLDNTEGHFIVQAFLITEESCSNCFTDIIMPERINEIVVSLQEGETVCESVYEVNGEIVAAIAIEAAGDYELYYSANNPEVGITVLRDGLTKAANAYYIASDLGYILRDEERYSEAIDAFLICEKLGADSEYLFHELAYCYEKIENKEKQLEYETKFKIKQAE